MRQVRDAEELASASTSSAIAGWCSSTPPGWVSRDIRLTEQLDTLVKNAKVRIPQLSGHVGHLPSDG